MNTDIMNQKDELRVKSDHHKNDSASKKDWLILIAFLIAYFLFWQITLRIAVVNPVYQGCVSLVSLALTLTLTVWLARTLKNSLSAAISLGLSSFLTLPAIFIPMVLMSGAIPAAMIPTVGGVFQSYGKAFHALPGLQGLGLIWLAVSLGVLLSRIIREIKLLLPIAIVLALVDLYVVFGGGLVTQANSGKSVIAQQAMKSLTVPLAPKIRTPKGVPPPQQLAVGFADYLFTALFFACFLKFSIRSRETFFWLIGTLCGYLLIVEIFRVDLPALVPIAVVVIGRNYKLFHYEAQERRDLLIAGVIVLTLLGGLFFASRRH